MGRNFAPGCCSKVTLTVDHTPTTASPPVAGFDPDMLDSLRAVELKAPFARTDGPGQL